MPAASPQLIEAVKASLANPAHAWVVQAASENASVEPEPDGETLDVLTRIVSLDSSYLGMQIVYAARLAPAFVSAQLMIDGASYQTVDADLFGAVDALAAEHGSAGDAALTARFTPPSGSVFPASIPSTVTFGQPMVG